MKKEVIILIIILLSLTLFLPLVVAQCEEFIDEECAELKWERAEARSGEIAEIVISPSNPNIMYVGIEVNTHSLYKSEDGGKTWRGPIGGGDHTKDVAVSSQDPNKVYFAMSEPLETTNLNIAPAEEGIFAHGSQGKETVIVLFTGLPPGGSSVSFSTVEIFEQDDKIIYAARKGGGFGPFGKVTPKIFKTIDGGNTWTDLEPNLKQVSVIEIHPEDHNLIYIGSRDGIYVSKDSGNTIKKLKSNSEVISIELQLDNPDVIYIASKDKVFKSIDAGENWGDITGPLEDIHRVRISRSDPNILYASTFNGVFRSDDYGETWVDRTGNLKAKNIQIVEIHPENPDIAFIGHSGLWSGVRADGRWRMGLLAHQGIFKTTDGGKTWIRSDDGIFEYDLEEVTVNPNRANEAWVAAKASRGGYKTNDAGYNWRLSQLFTLHYPMRIKYSMQDPDKIYATSWHGSGPFARSDDGGINWDMTSENVFFRGVNRGKDLLDRSEGGQIHVHGLAIDPNDDSIVYTGSVKDAQNPGGYPLEGAHIWKSTDSGKTWEESDEGFPHEKPTAIHDIQIDPKDTSIIYIATTEHESEIGIGIYKSIDSGKTWNAVNKGLDDLSVGALVIHPENPEILIAATQGGLYKSTNGGNSWTQTAQPESFDVEYVIDDPNTIYASTNNGVLKSKDFGDTWYDVNYDLPKGDGQGIGVDKTGNVIYATIKDEGVYVARLVDVKPIDPKTEFGSYLYGGPFGGPEGFPNFFGDDDEEEVFHERPSIFNIIIYFFRNLFGRESSDPSSNQPREFKGLGFGRSLKEISDSDLSKISEECRKTPKLPSEGYQGLLTDVHVHTMAGDDTADFAIKLLEEMNENGVDRITIQPNHGTYDHIKNSMGLDMQWGDISSVCPRIITLIYGFNPDEPDAWEYIKERLDTGQYGGVGEIEFQHGNLPIKHDPESESMMKIYDVLEQRKLALHFQADTNIDPSLEDKMYNIIISKTNIQFVWFGGCLSDERFMELTNLYCDTFMYGDLYQQDEQVLKISIIGTDSGPAGFDNPAYPFLPYNSFGEGMVQAREALSKLPKDVADKLAYENFDKVWPKN